MNPPFYIIPDSYPKPLSCGISVPGGTEEVRFAVSKIVFVFHAGPPSHSSETKDRGMVL